MSEPDSSKRKAKHESKIIGIFSGFPSRSFPRPIAQRLQESVELRDSLVFISAWPDDYDRNDADMAGMYNMFLEHGISFGCCRVVDSRTSAAQGAELISGASCIFLMGGHPERQRELLARLRLEEPVRQSGAVVLGVSAGAINMAVRSLDTKESPVPYEGLGLADVTVKPHFDPDNVQVKAQLMSISQGLPICALQDNSAIFVTQGGASFSGDIHWVHEGRLQCSCDEACAKLNKWLAGAKS